MATYQQTSSVFILFSGGVHGSYSDISEGLLFGDIQFRSLAEDCLKNYNPQMVSWDLTHANGLTGHGEVLLEGAKIIGGGDWQERADWIAQHVLHYYKLENGKSYRLTDESTNPTAGLMIGNSGVIHFLLRYYQPGKLSHPMLSC